MDDLIKRQDAIAACLNGFCDCVCDCVDEIEKLPPAQKTGKWIHDGKDFPHGLDWIHCSVCGKLGINVPADLTNYCPNCGAYMKGEEDG